MRPASSSPSTGIRDELPPITTFLNRLLALTIDLQNILFTAFEQLLTARIERAIASGAYDVGLETLRAESYNVMDRQTIYTHPGTSAETRLLASGRRAPARAAATVISNPPVVSSYSVASAGREWGADVRAYFSGRPCADPYRKLLPFLVPEHVPPGAHVAFVERPRKTLQSTAWKTGAGSFAGSIA